MKDKTKSSFVLFELVIVLLLVGIIYALATVQLKNPLAVEDEDMFNLKNKLNVFKEQPYDHIRLICFDDIEESCLIEKNEKLLIKNYTIPEGMEFYRFDQNNHQTDNQFEKKRLGKIYQKEVKFIFSLFPNGSNTTCIVELDDKYYTYGAYLDTVEAFNTLDDAMEQLLHTSLKSTFLVQ